MALRLKILASSVKLRPQCCFYAGKSSETSNDLQKSAEKSEKAKAIHIYRPSLSEGGGGGIVPGTEKNSDLTYDEVTHTGQAWDQEDWRLVRYTFAPKQVNPNVAMHLIAEVPPKACESRVTYCDGGNGALGHPKVYINLDKPGNHACGYCGLRFYRDGQPHDGSEHIQA